MTELKKDLIDYGFGVVNMCSILKPYKIGEEFIPEQNIYNEPQKK